MTAAPLASVNTVPSAVKKGSRLNLRDSTRVYAATAQVLSQATAAPKPSLRAATARLWCVANSAVAGFSAADSNNDRNSRIRNSIFSDYGRR
jgi:hypothetical protein